MGAECVRHKLRRELGEVILAALAAERVVKVASGAATIAGLTFAAVVGYALLARRPRSGWLW